LASALEFFGNIRLSIEHILNSGSHVFNKCSLPRWVQCN